MLISKELFVKTLKTLKESYEEMEKFQDAMEPFLHNPLVCKLGESARESLNNLLVEVCGCREDEDDIFLWWLFDGSKKEIEVTEGSREGCVYNVETPEGLYDYLYDMYHHDD